MSSGSSATGAPVEGVSLKPARPGKIVNCASLTSFTFPGSTITSAATIPAGTVTYGGAPIGEHCRVAGTLNQRVSPVDGQSYAIGFEMRLPTDWSGRFLHQANGGLDGSVAPALGTIAGQPRAGLQLGFAVLSSNAGHTAAQNPLFGLDPQARLDYGYQAVGSLTPMAKRLIRAAYGRGPDRSYMAGGSNGGRHTMVAASRYADAYDGFLAVAPGFNLPKAAVSQMWGAQQYAKVATDVTDLETALSVQERQVIADAILSRCDGLDRLVDGMVQDITHCQHVFDLDRHVATCTNGRDGSCLSRKQKQVVDHIFAGARTTGGDDLYSSFPFDPGLVQPGWANWEFNASVSRDPSAVGFIFSTPPADPAILTNLRGYALGYDVDSRASDIYASNDRYRESAMSFMTPPSPTRLHELRDRGAKMIVVHGASDAVFSADDTARWYEDLDAAHRGRADDFVRYFEVPGMGHVSGGPATDQYAGLETLIRWVEYGHAPDRIVASARGAGNPGGVNNDVPADWAPDRTRPLCPYPLVARYTGGDPEQADSFACKPGHGAGGQRSVTR
ncbi:tannase/feruloyl esterase family alpha/beta hydrolase [Streptomyces sp. NPDC046909]|uniref:tannase/feruloyl esterase family alpha/beta hydrolase n=1 Tax=Streptomyces sp. NPDC046909 TaxID=3155617 RepID=UPI0033D3B835